MKLNNETISKIAHLARLEVTDAEAEVLLEDMNKILSFMEKLNEPDTSGVDPLIYLTEGVNVTREDKIRAEITVEKALKNAPNQDGTYFRIAKVIDKS